MVERLRAAIEARNTEELKAASVGAAGPAAGGGAPKRPGRPSAFSTSPDTAVLETVLGMAVRTLRQELDTRGLPTGGSRTDMQKRLLDAMRQVGVCGWREPGEGSWCRGRCMMECGCAAAVGHLLAGAGVKG